MDLVEATDDDLERLADYWYRLGSEMEQYSTLNELAHDGPADVVAGIEQHHLGDDDTTVYLLEAGDTTVGYLLLRDGEHPSRTHDSYVRIVDLFVADGHRSAGYGSEAVEAVQSIARERGVDYVKVGCEWANRDARRFYEDNGFTEKHVTYVQRVE